MIWGTTWFAIRVCIAGYPTVTSVALRFAIAAALLLPIAVRRRPWPRGRAWAWLGLAGVLDAAAYLLVYLGEERVSGAVAAVLYGTQPLILGLLLVATRMEPVTRRHVIGSLVALAGRGGAVPRSARALVAPGRRRRVESSARWSRPPRTR